jgi:hypothetical protein
MECHSESSEIDEALEKPRSYRVAVEMEGGLKGMLTLENNKIFSALRGQNFKGMVSSDETVCECNCETNYVRTRYLYLSNPLDFDLLASRMKTIMGVIAVKKNGQWP